MAAASIYGSVDLGGDNDTAKLSNLTKANLGGADALNGGLGTDALTLDNVKLDGIARVQNWETIDATNDTELTLDGNLALGDSGTGTGSLAIDQSSTLYGGGFNASIQAFTAGQMANVVNAGRIDLTNGTTGATDRLTINGNYTGLGGLLLIQTELGDDNSASDRLVLSGGTASGSTGITVVNVGGAGAETTADGIMVVQAINGASSSANTFALASPVAAGAFEYFLFKGGGGAGSEENWYLRSTLTTPATPAPAPPVLEPAPEPEPEPPQTEAPPTAVGIAAGAGADRWRTSTIRRSIQRRRCKPAIRNPRRRRLRPRRRRPIRHRRRRRYRPRCPICRRPRRVSRSCSTASRCRSIRPCRLSLSILP